MAGNGRLLFAKYHVDHGIVLQLDVAVLYGRCACGHESFAGMSYRGAVRGGIVECVAGYHLRHVVGAASAEALAGVAAEFGLIAGERDVLDVRHAEVVLAVESGAAVLRERAGSGHTVESVHHKHGL